MKVVVALDKFKGSIDAEAACAIVADELSRKYPGADITRLPMADGGEGTARALMACMGGEWIRETATGPLPEMRVVGGYAWFPKQRQCLVEMAAASGISLLAAGQLNPLKTTTLGTGELLKAAFLRNCSTWLAVGGSATVDGGVGAAMALGWRFLDRGDQPVTPGGGGLVRIRRIVAPLDRVYPPLEVLCDVDNPLTGPSGAAAVFGPQKGASPEMVDLLEAGLANVANLVRAQLGIDVSSIPGGGAAGGLAAGAVAFLNATIVPGVDEVAAAVGLHAHVQSADWIITGEGRLDHTSLRGKVVSGVLSAAKRAGGKVVILAGQSALSDAEVRAAGIRQVVTLMRPPLSAADAIAQCRALLRARAGELILQ